MPSFDYSHVAQTALNLIAKFGRTVQHIAVIEGIYDPSTGAVTNTETSTNVMACDFAMKDNTYANGLVQAGDRYALVGNTISNINVSDRLIIDGVTWTINRVEKIAPAAILVAWKVFIRK